MARQKRRAIDAKWEHWEPDSPVWTIRVTEPFERLFVGRGASRNHEDVAVAAALLAMHRKIRYQATARADVALVTADTPLEVLDVREYHMHDVMCALRANGLHGSYVLKGTDKEYRF